MPSPYLIPATLATVALLWIGGEQHRENCIRAQAYDHCSIVPFLSKDDEPVKSSGPAVPQTAEEEEIDRLLRERER